jgi:hypothetical protein
MAVDWSYFNKFGEIDKKYLPSMGEGNTMATQMVTSVSKLVYKYYNDGDVFDNTYNLSGWWNDLSSYANWLYTYVPETRNILNRIKACFIEEDYENLLKELCDTTQTFEFLSKYENKPTVGTIYDCDGPYEYVEYEEDEDE